MIGIFGDSFAHEHGAIGWPTILSQLSDEPQENFALYGTSLSYSYRKLLDNIDRLQEYSKIIFICTEPGRLHLINNSTNHELLYNSRNATESMSLNNQFKLSKFNISNDEKVNLQVLHAAHTLRVHYPDTFDFVNDAVKRAVSSLHDKTLILNTRELANISKLDMKDMMPAIDIWEDPSLGRICHMSHQQNKELARYIKRHFDDGLDVHSTLIDAKTHYTESSTLAQAGLRMTPP